MNQRAPQCSIHGACHPLGCPRWLLTLTIGWAGVCLLAMRWSWSDTSDYAAGLAWELAAGAPLGLWLWGLARHRIRPLTRGEWATLLAAATLLRLILLPAAPVQSDDVYRYLWEGKVTLHGFSPYALAPDHAALVPLRDAYWPRINHPDLPAIYPPLAQYAFALLTALGSLLGARLLVMKGALALADVLGVWLLGRWLAGRGLHRGWAALWAFHPLAIVEFSGNGHLDSLMILPLLAALMATGRAPREHAYDCLASLGGLTVAIGVKLIPILLAPFWVWRLGRRAGWLGLVALLLGLTYLPFLGSDPRALFQSAGNYAVNWTGNAPAFDLLRALCGGNGYTARTWFLGGLLALIGGLWLRRTPPLRAALPVLGFYLVAGPMVHPWYLLLAWPLVLMRAAEGEARWAVPWLWLTLAVPLDYLRYRGDVDAPPAWLAWTIWLPFWAGLTGLGAQALIQRLVRKGTADASADPD